jgi:hemerythrin-like domain-containing protein
MSAGGGAAQGLRQGIWVESASQKREDTSRVRLMAGPGCWALTGRKEAWMKPRGQLMIEHRLIEKLLAAAAERANGMTQESYDPVLVDSIVDFIKTYADRTHHGKEEDILFRELSTKEVSGENLRVMNELIDEHKQARAKVGEITDLNGRYKSGDRNVVSRIKEIILWLAHFYPVHIGKEDKDFFPKSEKYFSAQELDKMVQDFWTFDRNMIHEKYQGLLESLLGK